MYSFVHSIVWTCHNLKVYFSVDGHLSCFQFEIIMNKLLKNIFVLVFLWRDFLKISFGLIPRSGIAGWRSSYMSNFTRNCWTVLQTDCTIGLFHHHIWEFLTNIRYCQYFLFYHSSGYQHLIVVLTCIFLTTNDVSIFSFAFGHLHIFFCEVPVQVFCSFKKLDGLSSY